MYDLCVSFLCVSLFLVLLFLTFLVLWLPFYLSLMLFSENLLWAVPLAFVMSPFFLLAFYGVLNYLIKKPSPGEYDNFNSLLMLQWGLKRNLYGVYALFFQKLFFISDPIRFLILRTFQAKIHPSSWITSSVKIFEPYFVSIGKESLIGEDAILATTLFPKTKTLMTYPITIGDYVLIGGFAGLGPGVHIENHCFIQQRAQIYAGVHVKKNSLIGYQAIIGKNTKVGENVKIGKFCFIGNELNIPDHTKIPENAVIKTQKDLNQFLKKKHETTSDIQKGVTTNSHYSSPQLKDQLF